MDSNNIKDSDGSDVDYTPRRKIRGSSASRSHDRSDRHLTSSRKSGEDRTESSRRSDYRKAHNHKRHSTSPSEIPRRNKNTSDISESPPRVQRQRGYRSDDSERSFDFQYSSRLQRRPQSYDVTFRKNFERGDRYYPQRGRTFYNNRYSSYRGNNRFYDARGGPRRGRYQRNTYDRSSAFHGDRKRFQDYRDKRYSDTRSDYQRPRTTYDRNPRYEYRTSFRDSDGTGGRERFYNTRNEH